MSTRDKIAQAKRIVVKVGTSTLTYENGNINLDRMEKLTRVLSDIVNQGKELTLVSSGAVAVGASKLQLKSKPKSTREKQAVSSVGQCELMHIYSKLFAQYSHVVGQVLLTKDVIEDKHIRKNVSNTFKILLKKGVIPIVNENDTIAIDEIENIVKFGDNDKLSAIVAALVDADLLIILSDIDGFYDSNPNENPDAKFIEEIDEVTEELEECAGGAGSEFGTGGMITKLAAAKIAAKYNVDMILANGENPQILREILNGKNIGTLFKGKK